MGPTAPTAIHEFEVDRLRVRVFEDRARLGHAAAAHVTDAIATATKGPNDVRVVFAAAPSQDEFLAGLVAARGLAWARVRAYQLDEYHGLEPDHPAGFRRYLREHLFRLIGIPEDRLHLIPGERVIEPIAVCLDYDRLVNAEPPDLICLGIGENGHLAFNDPPTADFRDPVGVKVVRLADLCREQQVRDGGFAAVEDVPTHAYTLTIPALMAAVRVSAVVPGPRKAEAVQAALEGPIAESCPASILRRHPDAVLFLDRDSARLVL